MTGYGRGAGSRHGFSFVVEMRSVNHRYADYFLRLPRELYPLEERVRRKLQSALQRGRVEVTVTLAETPAEAKTVAVDYGLAEAYREALRELAHRLGLPLELTVQDLIRLPQVLELPAAALPEEEAWDALEEALTEAMHRLLQQRREEGANLRRDLLQRLDRLKSLVREAAGRAPQALEECRLRMEKKFKEYLNGYFEESRLLMECALQAERMGIDEELVRLESHLESFAREMEAEGAVGRKLDFVAQEMFREINTLGSKAADYRLSQLVVEMKAELEKIREQIQNIE